MKSAVAVNRDTRVGMTADGLTTVRGSQMARQHGVIDPFAHWFITEAGDYLADKAIELDSIYAYFNLTRYGYTTQRLNELATQYRQMVFLGSGFDCRAMWLDNIQLHGVQVYEVETPHKLAEKMAVFKQHGVQIPPNTHHVDADLRDFHKIPYLLSQKGFRSQEPTLVLTEGVFFFLPTEITAALLNPRWLTLAPGSHVIFDMWTDERVNVLNTRTPAVFNGVQLFRPSPFFRCNEQLEAAMHDYGYQGVEIIPIDELTPTFFSEYDEPEFPDAWVMVEASY